MDGAGCRVGPWFGCGGVKIRPNPTCGQRDLVIAGPGCVSRTLCSSRHDQHWYLVAAAPIDSGTRWSLIVLRRRPATTHTIRDGTDQGDQCQAQAAIGCGDY